MVNPYRLGFPALPAPLREYNRDNEANFRLSVEQLLKQIVVATNTTVNTGNVFESTLQFIPDNTIDVGDITGPYRPRTVYAATSVVSPLGTFTTITGTLATASQPNVTTMANLTTIGTLIAGTVPAPRVSAGTFGAGAYVFPSDLTVTGDNLNVNGLTYTWPASQNANRVLRNTGPGTLAWSQVDLSTDVTGALAGGTVPASLVTAGTFGAGSYTFPSDLTITGPSTARMYFGTTGETVNLVVRRVVSAVAGANFIGEKARGSFGSESFANGSDPIARFAGRGWDGSAFTKSSAEWVVEAVENQSASALGGRMRLQIIPAGSTTETDQLNFINGKVTPATAGTFALGDSALPFGVFHTGENFLTTVAGPSLHLQYAKNTLSAPALPANNDIIGGLLFEGWNGTAAYTEQAAVTAQASQAWSTVGPAYGMRLLFKVTTNSSGASEITPWVMDHDGAFTPLVASTNTYDIGRSTATVRTGYFGTSVVSPVYDTAATDTLLKRAGTTMLTLGSATATFSKGDLTLTPASSILGIHSDTVDGTDTAVLKFGPGSTFSNTRGALVQLHGNEHANTGQLHLTSGNVTGATVLIQNKGSTKISVDDAASTLTGNWLNSADNTSDIGASGASRFRATFNGSAAVMGRTLSTALTLANGDCMVSVDYYNADADLNLDGDSVLEIL